ncbi:MAG: rhomboid family intramembrane serine protease [Candidatus Aenigmarchaeota archaeon]|nr:rhomboid family intramembrane serine protease [Candidatus Aenigmarchaeota archaeon]
MKATLALILICVVVFAYEVLLAPDSFFDDYGFSGTNMLSKPYVLVTSIFIHADLTHILSNIAVLFFFGIAVESELRPKKMLLIFFLGAFAGDLLSLFIYPFDAVSIGASAGIFALIGVGMIVKPIDFSLYPFFLPIPLALLGMVYTLYNAIGFFTGPSNISYIAHFGGLLVGLAFGIQKEGWRRGFMVIIVTFMILLLIPAVWLVMTQLG